MLVEGPLMITEPLLQPMLAMDDNELNNILRRYRWEREKRFWLLGWILCIIVMVWIITMCKIK
jgi:hypothetical protein